MCLTLSVSELVEEEFWSVLLYSIASVHRGLQVVFAQLFDVMVTIHTSYIMIIIQVGVWTVDHCITLILFCVTLSAVDLLFNAIVQ